MERKFQKEVPMALVQQEINVLEYIISENNQGNSNVSSNEPDSLNILSKQYDMVLPGECKEIHTGIKFPIPYGLVFDSIHWFPTKTKEILVYISQDSEDFLIYRVANFSKDSEYCIYEGDILIKVTLVKEKQWI